MLIGLVWLIFVILLFVGFFYLFEKGPNWTPLLVLFIVVVSVSFNVSFSNGFSFGSLVQFVLMVIFGMFGFFLYAAIIQNDLEIEHRNNAAAEERKYQEYVQKHNRDQ